METLPALITRLRCTSVTGVNLGCYEVAIKSRNNTEELVTPGFSHSLSV